MGIGASEYASLLTLCLDCLRQDICKPHDYCHLFGLCKDSAFKHKAAGFVFGEGGLETSPPLFPSPPPFQTINSCQAYVKDEIIGAHEALITLFWRDYY